MQKLLRGNQYQHTNNKINASLQKLLSGNQYQLTNKN